MPKISVCLPVYNGAAFLREAIESVLAQTETDFELLIGDDCSTDDSAAIAASYAAKDARIKCWVNQRNLGLFANYNECMRRAGGIYIKPFAQDDLLNPAMLQRESALLAANPDVKLVSCARNWIDSDGLVVNVVRPFEKQIVLEGKDVIRFNYYRLTNWVGEPSTVMFRRADVGESFDTRFYHYGDIEYWFRIMESGKYAFIDEVLCRFRRHEGSSTSGNLSGLYFAFDMLLLGEKFARYSREIGETPEQFNHRALELAARQLNELVASGLSLDEVLAAVQGNEEQRARQLAAFKELSFHCLRYMTELLSECHHLRCSVTDYDEIVQEVRQNRFWRLTGPLRKLAGDKVPVVDPEVPKVSSGRPVARL